MSSCRDLRESLYEFVARELPAQRQDELHQHVSCCPPCAAFVDSYQVTIQLARRLPPLPLSPECWARLQTVIQGESPPA
jgi:hypothetical protein